MEAKDEIKKLQQEKFCESVKNARRWDVSQPCAMLITGLLGRIKTLEKQVEDLRNNNWKNI